MGLLGLPPWVAPEVGVDTKVEAVVPLMDLHSVITIQGEGIAKEFVDVFYYRTTTWLPWPPESQALI